MARTGGVLVRGEAEYRWPGRPGLTLYPTIEVAPSTPATDAYLTHNPIPAQFTEEDFDQVHSGNFVTKVIYLPDPAYQDLTAAGPDEIVSSRLEPGIAAFRLYKLAR